MSKKSLKGAREVSGRKRHNAQMPIKRIWPSAEKLSSTKSQVYKKLHDFAQQKPELFESVILSNEKISHQIWPNRQTKCQKPYKRLGEYNIQQKPPLKQGINQEQEDKPHLSIPQTLVNGNQSKQINKIKLVLVGDSSVGKTCMLASYTSDQFPTEHTPTIFDNYLADIKFQNKLIKLQLWDTGGQQQFAPLRSKFYENADVFFVCFSLVDIKSFDNALQKWLPETQQANPQAIKMVIGTKEDIHNEYLIDLENAYLAIPFDYITMKCEQKGCNFMACSGLTQKGLYRSFDEAMTRVLKIKTKKNKEQQQSCKII